MLKSDYDRKIILEDGREYYGYSFGASGNRVCEIVFNTSMAGYQEILSDLSYTDQAVVMTYPLIGNYGMAGDDYESAHPSIGALIVRQYNDEPSHYRSVSSLSDVMKKYDIPGVYGVDTRSLTRSIRDRGSRKALITDVSTTLAEGLSILKNSPVPHDAVSRVSCRHQIEWPADQPLFHVAAIDCGMKTNIARSFAALGCQLTILPWNTSAAAIEQLRPDGIFLSNGPGDPEDVPETIETVRSLIGKYPIFGICLGHQILALAYGAKTYKLHFGHRGGNHPVKNLETGSIEITSQNHSYAVDAGSLAATPLTVTHINLLDGTIEGLKCAHDRVFSVQYHPESAPGPRDSFYLFEQFLAIMKDQNHA